MRRFPFKYEIINPIDPYSITSSSEIHAAAAVIMLSDGHFGLRRRYGMRSERMGELVMPAETFSHPRLGARALELWWNRREECLQPLNRTSFFGWCAGEMRGIADALDTVQLEAAQPTSAADLVLMAQRLSREFRRGIARGVVA